MINVQNLKLFEQTYNCHGLFLKNVFLFGIFMNFFQSSNEEDFDNK